MKRIGITQAKNNLSALIDGLESGSSVIIVDRGRPVARLEPINAGPASSDDRLAGLQRDGLVRAARSAAPRTLFDRPPPRAKKGASVVEALLRERREGR